MKYNKHENMFWLGVNATGLTLMAFIIIDNIIRENFGIVLLGITVSIILLNNIFELKSKIKK